MGRSGPTFVAGGIQKIRDCFTQESVFIRLVLLIFVSQVFNYVKSSTYQKMIKIAEV